MSAVRRLLKAIRMIKIIKTAEDKSFRFVFSSFLFLIGVSKRTNNY